jgi:hypothetical protein
MNQESSGMAKGFVCIKCGIGTLVKSNMKMTPDGKPYCRNEIGCAARVAKQWSKPLDNPLGPKNDFDLWTGRFESRKQELINGGMAPELADEQASMEVRRSIREDGRL